MKIINNVDEILEILNNIRYEKRIGIEKISKDISKDKTVISRIFNGQYKLDLTTFINICSSLDIDPTSILEQVLHPDCIRITISKKNVESLQEIIKSINDYKN